jgi:uncharacterized protein (TIGR04222 family)
MTALAAGGDTWGIPGPAFAGFYLAGAFVVILASVIWRSRVAAGRATGRPGPFDVAYLTGGPSLAATSALAALRTTNSVTAAAGGRLAATGPMPMITGELDRAVYAAAGRGVTQRELAADPGVAQALDRMRTGLVQDGWLLDEPTRRRVRLTSLPVFAVALIGVGRLVDGLQHGKPVGFLVAELIGVSLVGLRMLAAPTVSGAAKAMVNELRRQRAELSPRRSPAWSVYGPSGVALGVALFGTAALWAADPVFAGQAEIQRQALGAGGSSSSSCGSGDGGGGDGGGGGCGGGCGGCGG